MNIRTNFLTVLAISAASFLAACGGGKDDTTPSIAATSKFSSGLSALTTAAGLTSAAVANLFDAAYLDAGVKKADVLAALGASAQALATNPELSLFPQVDIISGTVSNCDANSVCTFTATLANSDADITTVDFTAKVKLVDGFYYFYGDQSATTSI